MPFANTNCSSVVVILPTVAPREILEADINPRRNVAIANERGSVDVVFSVAVHRGEGVKPMAGCEDVDIENETVTYDVAKIKRRPDQS